MQYPSLIIEIVTEQRAIARSIGERSQDLKYAGEPTRAEIGDRNTFREFVTVHRGTTSEAPTVIGSDNNFLAYAHVAHDSVVGNHCILSNAATLGGHVTVEDYVILSGLAGVTNVLRFSVSRRGSSSPPTSTTEESPNERPKPRRLLRP